MYLQIIRSSTPARALCSTRLASCVFFHLIRVIQYSNGMQKIINSHLQNELEASVALSRPPATHPDIPPSRRALSLTLLARTRNPSQLARALYLSPPSTRHAFLSGTPAEDLGGLPLVHPSYFYTSARWREHRRGLGLPEDEPPGENPEDGEDEMLLDMMPMGTVGAVALDVRRCVAVCTSTGGRTNKLPGRVGDTPHNGAGFWAEEWQAPRGRWRRWLPRPWRSKVRAVGVSGTGDGDVRTFPCATPPPDDREHRVDAFPFFLVTSTLFARIQRRRWHTGCNTSMSRCIKLLGGSLRRFGGMKV